MSAPSVTALAYVCAAVVLTSPPLIAVVPVAFVIVTLVSAVLCPTVPPNVVSPVLVIVRLLVPFTVPLNTVFTPVSVVFALPRVTLSL